MIIFSSCSKSKVDLVGSSSKYGVIETTSQENKSYISFYDDKLKKTGEELIQYGSMGDGFLLPEVYERSMLIVPQGIYTTKELTFVMEYDLDSGEISEHETGLDYINSMAISEDNVYAVNTINRVTTIAKVNRETKKINLLELNEVYISYMDIYDGKIFAFADDDHEENLRSIFYVIDSDSLEVLNQMDITEVGYGQNDTLYKDGKIYFTSSFQFDGDTSIPVSRLSYYDVKNETIQTRDIEVDSAFQII